MTGEERKKLIDELIPVAESNAKRICKELNLPEYEQRLDDSGFSYKHYF